VLTLNVSSSLVMARYYSFTSLSFSFSHSIQERFGAAILWDSGASVGEITGHSKGIASCDFKATRPFRVITGAEDFQANW
jgi:hypothetical protein